MSELPNLDSLYKAAISTLPLADKLDYCRQRLDKLQHLLERNGAVLDSRQKTLIKEMVQTVQEEISQLENNGKHT